MKLRTLKILTDENISPKVVSFLRQDGFDVLDTKEQQWYGKNEGKNNQHGHGTLRSMDAG